MSRAVKVQGIECPFFREGDNLVDVVVDSVLEATEIDWSFQDKLDAEYLEYNLPKYKIHDKDVIGIKESIVARTAGQYVTVDEIAADIEKKFGKDATICLVNPIYSRNRFSLILKGIARAAKKIIIVMPENDEVGNPRGVNPFTGVNIEEYYRELCESEKCECEIVDSIKNITDEFLYNWIDCRLHLSIHLHDHTCYDLTDICSGKSPDWGVLGTNKAGDRLKLFPSKEIAQKVCDEVKAKIKEKTGKDVIVCVYGDGCFKDPVGGIWEFADPVSMPAYTDKKLIESTPCELKLKDVIDMHPDKEDNDIVQFMVDCTRKEGKIGDLGTTPRVYRDLLASLMDLTSGSGDRATPVVLVQNYF